jgi:membrane protein involved in colicin uptake
MSTGNGRGAPRIGSITIDSPGAIEQRARRQEKPEAVRLYGKEYQREYRKDKDNLEKLQKTAREGYHRRKAQRLDPNFVIAVEGAYCLAANTNVRVRTKFTDY